MAKDHRIRLTDREIKLTRDALEVLLNLAAGMCSPKSTELRAIFVRFASIKAGGQSTSARAARRSLRGEGCPESKL